MKRITVEVSPELHRRLRLLAYADDLSLGAVCRRALADYCEARQADRIQLTDERTNLPDQDTRG